MKDRMFRNALTVGIILLFIGVTVTPSIAVNTVTIEDASGKGSGDDIDWWPMFRHDLNHSGYSTSSAPDTNNVSWNYATGDKVLSSPAVADGKVYIGSNDNKVYCLNADNGNEIWNYLISGDSGWISSSPAVKDGRIYIGNAGGLMYCLDNNTGNKIWTTKVGWMIQFSSPAVSDNKVYIGSYENSNTEGPGAISCLDSNTGNVIWDFHVNGRVSSSPALFDGKVYFGSWNNKVYCLNAITGNEVWNYTTDSHVYSSPAVLNGKVYVGSYDSNIYCLDAENGSKIWNHLTGEIVVSSPAIAGGRVYVGSEDTYLYCLDSENGDLIWRNATSDEIVWCSPAVADEKVYVGSFDNKLYCFDAGNGDLIWSKITGSHIQSSPAVADGKLYIGSQDGKVYCFGENQPPNKPDIDGPTSGKPNIEYDFSFNATDPNDDAVMYIIEWGDNYTEWTEYSDSGEEIILTHSWSEPGTYTIKAKAKDVTELESKWSYFEVKILNEPPETPIIIGPNSGKPNTEYDFTFNSTDPDDDDIAEYIVDWGDDTGEETITGPFQSGEEATGSHIWTEDGTYIIKAKAKDIFGVESNWSEHEISIPRNRATSYLRYQWFLECFPLLERLLGLIRMI
jgi:outer membrane protein assembly factor BamB